MSDSYRAFIHACPHRIRVRFVFLNQELKLLVPLLSSPVEALVSPDAPGTRRHIEAAAHVVRRTRGPVKQIQKGVGITKGQVQITQVPLGVREAQTHSLGVRHREAAFGNTVGVTRLLSPQRCARIPCQKMSGAGRRSVLLVPRVPERHRVPSLAFRARGRSAQPQAISEQDARKQEGGQAQSPSLGPVRIGGWLVVLAGCRADV